MPDAHNRIDASPMDQLEQAQFFKDCRHRLGMSVRDLQVELCFLDEQTILKIEDGRYTIHGATWVALMYVLDENGHEELADRVHALVEGLRDQIGVKRTARWQKWQDRKKQRYGDSPLEAAG
jgi:hypothetical protein